MEITLPFSFKPRNYQIPILKAWDSGIKRMFWVAHRRSGKDKTIFANLPKKMMERKGTYYYFLPTYSQAKKVIWTGADKSGFKFLDHFPKEIVKTINQSDMIIELINGSILQMVGADNIDRIVGTNPIGVVFSEYSLMKPDVWNFISPILRENDGWAIFIMTPRGINHAWDLMKTVEHDPNWFVQTLTVEDTKALSLEALEEARKEMPGDLFKQEYYCFTPDTDIITIDGIKKINQIKSGDFVLTHSNRFRKVLGVNEREYEGKLNIIDTYGSNRPLKLTPEHRVRVTNDGLNYKWIEAKNITNKDRLTFPKILPRNNKIIDKAMAILIAWFIVEGSARKSQVTFTLNENEVEYAEQIKNCLNIVNKGTIHEIVKDGSRQIINNNADLVEFLISQCGSGALNKKIPFQIISGYEQLVYDILIKGDGHFSNSKDSFTTISETLGYQIQLLANMLGYTSGITFRKNEGTSYIQGRKVNIHNSIQIRIQKTKIKSGAKLKYHKYSVSSSLKSNKIENYSGKVYNLEVEIDNSYTANGRVVHNCTFLDNGLGFFKRIDENIYKMEEYQPKELALYQLGVDLAKYNDFTVISPFNLNDFHLQKQDSFNQMDYNLQKARIENAYLKHNKGMIVIDSTGVGEPVFDDLSSRGMNITPFRFNKASRTDLLRNLQMLLEQDKIKIPNDDVLITELKSMSYSLNENGTTSIQVPDGKHDDRIMSLALAVWQIPQQPIHINTYTRSVQTGGVESFYPDMGTN